MTTTPAAQRRPLRAAIVGPGYIGAVHAEALRRCGGELDTVIGRPGADIAARAAAMGAARYGDRLEDALDNPAIDVVHICTPNALHYPLARAVLEHGKHLVCEKPLTTDASQASELVQLASARGVVAGVAYCYRYYPLVFQARHLLATGALGSVHNVRGLYLADELLHTQYFHYRFAPEIAGPSLAMADIGVHWCDLAEFVIGQHIVEVCADGQTVIPHREWRRDAPGAGPAPAGGIGDGEARQLPIAMEDSLSLLLRFDRGARGALAVSQVSAGHKNRLTLSVDGATAGLDWNQEEPNTLAIRRPAPASESLIKDPLLLAPEAAALARFPGGHPEGYPDAFRQCIAAIYAAIERPAAAQATPYPTLADGLRGVLMVGAVLRSLAERRWVTVPST